MEQSISTKQPRQLYLLFFAEMWERFSFYGMKALLIAYMVTELKFDEPRSYGILGAYSALVYTVPMLGGMLADRILGYRKAVIYGGILMSIGHLVLALPQDWSFFYGMAFIICGNGFFKPNISSLVGTLYTENDPRRDSGFSLFYMGINIGAALGGLLCGYVGQRINWHYGFGLAGIFMILGLVVFAIGQKSLGHRGLPPQTELLKRKTMGISSEYLIYLGALVIIPLVVALFNRHEIMDYLMGILGIIAIVYVLWEAFRMERAGRNKLLAALFMIIFSILFWAFYEQNAGSLNLFAMRNVDMNVMGTELPALAVNNFLPPGWVVILSFFFAWLWTWLAKRNAEPNTPVKFGFSFLFIALGFFVFYIACLNADQGRISLLPFAMGYMFIIAGELCLSPIGLSMVTKLSPARMVAVIMGIWFFASAGGEFLAGKIGKMMSVPEAVQQNAIASLPYYATILKQIAMASALTGLLILGISPLIRRWMGNIK
ncbi:peptide MFS transporter [Niabella terrae]